MLNLNFITMKKILVEDFGLTESAITEDSTFKNLGMDSLDEVELEIILNVDLSTEASDQLQETTTLVEFIKIVNKDAIP